MLWAEGREGGVCLGWDSSQSSRGPIRACCPHLGGPKTRGSGSPEGVDVDEPSGIAGLIVTLHVHAAERGEAGQHTLGFASGGRGSPGQGMTAQACGYPRYLGKRGPNFGLSWLSVQFRSPAMGKAPCPALESREPQPCSLDVQVGFHPSSASASG